MPIGGAMRMVMARQMRSGLWQSWHLPSTAHGVRLFSRLAFIGPAISRARRMALGRSGASLLMPHTT